MFRFVRVLREACIVLGCFTIRRTSLHALCKCPISSLGSSDQCGILGVIGYLFRFSFPASSSVLIWAARPRYFGSILSSCSSRHDFAFLFWSRDVVMLPTRSSSFRESAWLLYVDVHLDILSFLGVFFALFRRSARRCGDLIFLFELLFWFFLRLFFPFFFLWLFLFSKGLV